MAEYTAEGLPIVTEGQRESMENDIDTAGKEDSIEQRTSELIDMLEKEQPELARHIGEMAPSFSHEEKAIYYATGVITGYEILRRQAEANKLEEEIIQPGRFPEEIMKIYIRLKEEHPKMVGHLMDFANRHRDNPELGRNYTVGFLRCYEMLKEKGEETTY